MIPLNQKYSDTKKYSKGYFFMEIYHLKHCLTFARAPGIADWSSVISTANYETSFWNGDGSWSPGPSLPILVYSHCLVKLSETASYLIGGYNANDQTFYSSVYKFDWISETWTKMADLNTPRACEFK